MSGNSFWEPGDSEKTVLFRPVPGGAAAAGSPPTATMSVAPQPAAAAGVPIGPLVTGQSPLIDAAMPLLQLLARLRDTTSTPDATELRTRAMQALRDFENAGRAANLPFEMIHPARYVLCASLDDLALHTRWGGASSWVQSSLVSSFHQEVISGEAFFELLAALKREPARNLMLLELIYLCLALGYQGMYRLSRHGPAQLEQLREDLYQTIARLRPPYEKALSLRWEGVRAPYRPARAVLPVWVMALIAAALLGAAWADLFYSFNDSTVAARTQVAALPPLRMPDLVRPPPPAPAAPQRQAPPPDPPKQPQSDAGKTLRHFLEPEIRRGEVVVEESPGQVSVRVYTENEKLFKGVMFASGSADVDRGFEDLLERIGEALNAEPGFVTVTGHTDKVPIRTARFPSNYDLSLARARAASVIMMHRLQDPRRLIVQGKGDTMPLDRRDTPDAYAQNRRIEILLERRM